MVASREKEIAVAKAMAHFVIEPDFIKNISHREHGAHRGKKTGRFARKQHFGIGPWQGRFGIRRFVWTRCCFAGHMAEIVIGKPSWCALAWIAPERNFAVLATTNMGGEGVFDKIDAVVRAVIQDHILRRR